MSVFSVAEKINKHISFKFLPKLHRHLHQKNNCFNVIRIHMKDGGQSYFRNISTVSGGTAVQIICGETNLIICDEMNRSACFVCVKTNHLHNLIQNSLPCNSSISVNKNRTEFGIITRKCFVNLCAGNSFCNAS